MPLQALHWDGHQYGQLPCSPCGRAEPPDRFAPARAVMTQLGAGAAVLGCPACQGGQITLSYLQDLLEVSLP